LVAPRFYDMGIKRKRQNKFSTQWWRSRAGSETALPFFI
jgi:hypothetical protein